ncbi:MAG: single-stranded DNA-binding protein [Planctomycetota bacterium]|nr:single-stranded DNA-binding protein [Planctomycetota bacterium]
MEINRVFIAGNLTRDPELRMTPGGTAVCDLGLASNRRYRKQGDEQLQEETCFVTVTVWGRQAENCNQYLSKGKQVVVEGRLKYDQWTDKDSGKNRNKLTVVADRVHFMPRSSEGGSPQGGSTQGGYSATGEQSSGGQTEGFPQGQPFNDEVPF